MSRTSNPHHDTNRIADRPVIVAAVVLIAVVTTVALSGGAAAIQPDSAVPADAVHSEPTVEASAQLSDNASAEYDRDAADVIYDDAEHNDLQGEILWRGQVVLLSGLTPGETYQLREGTPDDDRGLATELTADGNGTVQIDTAARNDSRHYVRGEFEDDQEATIEIVEQSIRTFEFDPDELPRGDETALTIDSNRGTYTAYLTAEDVDAATLAAAIDDAEYDEAADAARVDDADGTVAVETDSFPEENVTVDLIVADSTAAAEASITVEERPDAAVAFDDPITTASRGDWATIAYEVDGTDETTLRIGNDDVRFNVTVDVVVDDPDEPVEVAMNTYEVAREEVDIDDAIEVENAASVDATLHSDPFDGDTRLEAGSYSLRLTGDDAADAGSLRLTDRSTDDLTAFVAPIDSTFDEPEPLVDGISRADAASNESTVAEGDTLVFQVEATGLYGYLLDDEGELATEEGIEFTIEANDSAPHASPDRFEIGDLDDEEAVTIVEDSDNDQFFVVIDTDEFAQDGAELEVDEEYEATFAVHYHNDYIAFDELDEIVRTTFTVEERTVALDDDPVTVESATEQTIGGTATIAPGSELLVAVEADEPPFYDHERTTVEDNGTWQVTFDDVFDGVRENATFEVEVSGDAETDADGVVTSRDDGEDVTPTPTETPASNESTPTQTPDPTPTPDSTPTGTPVDAIGDEDPTEEGVPGFGIGSVIAALLAVWLVVGRRSGV